MVASETMAETVMFFPSLNLLAAPKVPLDYLSEVSVLSLISKVDEGLSEEINSKVPDGSIGVTNSCLFGGELVFPENS